MFRTFRTLVFSTLVVGCGVLVSSANSVQAEDEPAKAIQGKWKVDALAMMKEDEGYKKGTAEEKKQIEKEMLGYSLDVEITADKITSVEVEEGRKQDNVAGYKIKKSEGKTLILEMTNEKSKEVKEAKFEILSEKKIKVTIDNTTLAFDKQ